MSPAIPSSSGGVPEGSGGLIARYHHETGAFYFEGTFSAGLPDGVLLVEEPGRKQRTREFRAGKDVGNGAATEVQRLMF